MAAGSRRLTIEAVITRWGVAAVFAGAALEGETSVLAGGLLAHQGLVSPIGAFVAAAGGSFVADQIFFAIGRRWRDHPRVRRIMARRAFARALGWLERWPVGFIFAFRFLYGLRTVSPVAIGTSRVPARTFVAINLAAACTWAALFTGIGYCFGQAVTEALGRYAPSRRAFLIGAGALAAVVLIVQGVRYWRRR